MLDLIMVMIQGAFYIWVLHNVITTIYELNKELDQCFKKWILLV